jgi:hypothetical protein
MTHEQRTDPIEPVPGCREHTDSADADCVLCLDRYGLTLATPERRKLMHPDAIRGRFRKGVSGNPSGPKPGSHTLEQIVKHVMSEVIESTDPNIAPMERLEILARVVASKAVTGTPWAAKALLERLYPKRIGIDLLGAANIQITFDDQDRELMERLDDEDPGEGSDDPAEG